MAGEGDDPRIVSSAFIDAPKAELVVARARKLREEYGNVTGHAIGQGPAETVGMDLLGDILKVVGADEEQVWNERIAGHLAELRPDVYDGWTAETVTAGLKPMGRQDRPGMGHHRRGRGQEPARHQAGRRGRRHHSP